MPIDVGETINSIGDAFLRAPVMGGIARSPIYTGLLITFVLMLIIMFTFRDADTEESLLVLCLRCGFWSFLFLTAILFLHNKVLARDCAAGDRESIYGGLFADSTYGRTAGASAISGAYDPEPRLYGAGEHRTYSGEQYPQVERPAAGTGLSPAELPIAGADGIAYIPVRTVPTPIPTAAP